MIDLALDASCEGHGDGHHDCLARVITSGVLLAERTTDSAREFAIATMLDGEDRLAQLIDVFAEPHRGGPVQEDARASRAGMRWSGQHHAARRRSPQRCPASMAPRAKRVGTREPRVHDSPRADHLPLCDEKRPPRSAKEIDHAATLDPRGGHPRNTPVFLASRRHLAEHRLQNPAVSVVADFDRSVDAAEGLERDRRTAGLGRAHRDRLPRLQLSGDVDVE